MSSEWKDSLEKAGVSVTYETVESGVTDSWSAADLIRMAKEHPPEPIVEGILFSGDILVIHGTEESYKSVFIVQLAESVATGRPFLRRWKVPGSRRVGIIETEMHPTMMGGRLAAMFKGDSVPARMLFWNAEALKRWRRENLPGKVSMIAEWVNREGIEVLIIDTANDFFRGEYNPSDERHVGELFDKLRTLSLKATILVRHDHKKRETDGEAHSNEMIRGSAEWKEDPEAIIYLKRGDKRTNKVELQVGKLRYCAKPEPLTLWFDAGCFRLTPLPPLITVLEAGRKIRRQVIEECKARFGVEVRLADEMIAVENEFLTKGGEGHNRTFEINPETAAEAVWAEFLTHPGG